MPAPYGGPQDQIQREIDRLTRDLQRHDRAPGAASPAVLRAYHVLLERAYRRMDQLDGASEAS
jgi:hypothetical protein